MDLLSVSDADFKDWADERILLKKEISPKEYIGNWGEHDKEVMTFLVNEFIMTLPSYKDKPAELLNDIRKFKKRVNKYMEDYRKIK